MLELFDVETSYILILKFLHVFQFYFGVFYWIWRDRWS